MELKDTKSNYLGWVFHSVGLWCCFYMMFGCFKVTASHDPNALFQYNMQWRLQPPKEEIILDLEEITHEHLKYFAAKNAKSTNMVLPERIIFYRDGVSDGQFDMVRDTI